jgi:hypothetical protein
MEAHFALLMRCKPTRSQSTVPSTCVAIAYVSEPLQGFSANQWHDIGFLNVLYRHLPVRCVQRTQSTALLGFSLLTAKLRTHSETLNKRSSYSAIPQQQQGNSFSSCWCSTWTSPLFYSGCVCMQDLDLDLPLLHAVLHPQHCSSLSASEWPNFTIQCVLRTNQHTHYTGVNCCCIYVHIYADCNYSLKPSSCACSAAASLAPPLLGACLSPACGSKAINSLRAGLVCILAPVHHMAHLAPAHQFCSDF